MLRNCHIKRLLDTKCIFTMTSWVMMHLNLFTINHSFPVNLEWPSNCIVVNFPDLEPHVSVLVSTLDIGPKNKEIFQLEVSRIITDADTELLAKK
jgi:hypothetical protein